VSDHITVQPARPDELDTVAELWDKASRWLGSRGIDQWQYPPRRETIAHNIAAGDQRWLVEEDGRVIGTITVDVDPREPPSPRTRPVSGSAGVPPPFSPAAPERSRRRSRRSR
jgi:hypothetical protein